MIINQNGVVLGQLKEGMGVSEAQMVVNSDTVDLSKLANYEGLVHSDITAAQLIYSALSAISQDTHPQVQQQQAQLQGNVLETSVTSMSQDGVTTHTITFHLPNQEGGAQTQVTDSGQQLLLAVQPSSVPQVVEEQSQDTIQVALSANGIQPELVIEGSDVETDGSNMVAVIEQDMSEAEPTQIVQS